MAATMALAARSGVMGAGFEVGGALRAFGWAATGTMALAVAAMAAAAAL
jgi:hypothetical protein